MPLEQNDQSGRRTRTGFHLLPCAVVTGVEVPAHDDRLLGAQSALNRVQVWLGDRFMEFRHRRQIASTSLQPASRIGDNSVTSGKAT
jgi:hypothetical protein